MGILYQSYTANGAKSGVSYDKRDPFADKRRVLRTPIKPYSPPSPISFKTALLSRLPSNFDFLHFVLSLLKVSGQAPFECTGKGDSKKYFFTWPSFDSAACLMVASVALFGWFIFLTHIGLSMFLVFGPGIRHSISTVENILLTNPAFDARKKEASIGMFRLLNILVTFQQILHIVWGWIGRHKLVSVMNSWLELRREILKLDFSTHPSSKASRECIGYYMILLVTSLYFAGCTIVGCLGGLLTFRHEDQLLESAFMSTCFGYFAVTESLHDIKTTMLFYELARNFKQVHEVISRGFGNGRVSENQVFKWHKVLLMIRKQNSVVVEYLTVPQLALLLQCVVLGLVTIFLAITASWDTQVHTQEFALSISIWLLMRLFIKAVIAEKITEQEAAIAVELMERKDYLSEYTEVQLKDLRSILLMNPTVVNFANLVILQKKICLGVISQIVTYLIVLFQFYSA